MELQIYKRNIYKGVFFFNIYNNNKRGLGFEIIILNPYFKMNKIKKLMGFKEVEYIDIRLLNKSYSKGLRLVKLPIRKLGLILCIIIIVIAMLTPFTNWFLIPLSIKVFNRFG